MTNLSAEKIEEYYHNFRYHEIGFDEKTVEATGLIQRELYIQCGKSRWPCRIRTASLTGAKVEVKLSQEEVRSILESGEVSINYSFAGLKAMPIPMSYTVYYTITGQSSLVRLKGSTWILSLSTAKKPPDYFIEVLGDLLHFRANSTKRHEERIAINANSVSQLGLKSSATHVFLDGQDKKCVVRDLSLSGAAVVISSGDNKKPEQCTLRLLFLDPDMMFELKGSVMRYQLVKGSSTSYFVGLHFEEESVPMEYKMRIHTLLEES